MGATERLAERIGYQLTYEQGSGGVKAPAGQRSRLIAAHAAAVTFYREQLQLPEAAHARDLLVKRLTDGESNNTSRYYETDSYYGLTDTSIRCDRLIIRDPITKYEVTVDTNRIDAQTDALIRLLKNRTKSNVIGFYVISGRDFNRKVYHWFTKNQEMLKEEFRRSKFMILENTGYDEYYILKSSSLDTDEDSTFEVKEGATFRGIASAFTKYNSGKHNSRVVLNRFIGLIA